jgi:type II secretory pathway pseudopilin PulG
MNLRPTNKGFSTVEMLIAMTVMSLMLGAIILVIFGSQSFVSDAAASTAALSLATSALDVEHGLAQKDFGLLVATSSAYAGSPSYTTSISIESDPDYVSKKITATVTWVGDHLRPQHVVLTSYVADYKNATNANTCNAAVSGDWSHPIIQNVQTNFAQMIGDSSGVYTLAGIDAYKGKLYVTAQVSGATKKNFFIFDTTQGPSPQLLGSLDTTGTSLSGGGTAVVVATSSLGNYAYVANSYNTAQLQIVDITNPANPTLITNYQLPTTTTSAHITGAGTSGASGSSIFYKDGYVYIGLTKTTTGPEFNIIDVHNPHAPVWVGGYKVGYVVNALYVANNVAYIAHPTDSTATTQEQVTVLSLADKTNPVRIGGYKAPDKQGNGKSLYGVGDTLYLGRTVNTTVSNNDMYVLQNLNPVTGIKINSSIDGLVVRGSLAFLLSGTSGTPGSLEIFNLASSTSTPLSSIALPSASSGAAMDCEGNTVYAASNDVANKGYLSVIYP